MNRLGYPRQQLQADAIKIIVHANSLGAGTGASGPSAYWPAVLATRPGFVGKGITIVNRSVAGMGIATSSGAGTMIAHAPANVDNQYDSTKHNVLIVHEFINELKANGFSASAAWASMKTYIAARRASASGQGCRFSVVIITTTPVGSSPVPGDMTYVNIRNAAAVAANNLIRQDWGSCCDLMIDLAAMEPFRTLYQNNLWVSTVFTGSSVYDPDLAHLNDAGYVIFANIVAQELCRLRVRNSV